MSRSICVFYLAVHISLRICVSLLGEHKSLGICVFRQYKQRTCLLRYSKKKKTTFLAIKTRTSTSRKSDIF